MNFCEGLNQQRSCGIYSKYARILTRLTPVTFTFMSPVQKSNVLGKLIVHFHELNELALTIAAALLETISWGEKRL